MQFFHTYHAHEVMSCPGIKEYEDWFAKNYERTREDLCSIGNFLDRGMIDTAGLGCTARGLGARVVVVAVRWHPRVAAIFRIVARTTTVEALDPYSTDSLLRRTLNLDLLRVRSRLNPAVLRHGWAVTSTLR